MTEDRDWTSCREDGCGGIRQKGYPSCLRHLPDEDRVRALDRGQQGPIDVRGTVVDRELLELITYVRSSDDGTPTFGELDFRHCLFTSAVDLSQARFGADAAFDHATFQHSATFKGCEFTGEVSFGGTRFDREAVFDSAKFSGEVTFDVLGGPDLSFDRATFEQATLLGAVAADSVRFTKAVFEKPVTMVVVANSAVFTGTRFEGGVHLQAHRAQTFLAQVYFGEPSSLSGLPTSFLPRDAGRVLARSDGGEWMPLLMSIQQTDVENLVLADVDLSACRFAGAHQLEKLRLEGSTPFARSPAGWHVGRTWPPIWRWSSRQVLAEEDLWRARSAKAGGWGRGPQLPDQVGPERLTVLYRALRRALEDGKNEPGAGDFYYGEMEARRHLPTSRGAERLVLTAYWALSGYGQRASRAFAALAVLVAVLTALLAGWGLPQSGAVQEMTGLVQPPTSPGAPQPFSVQTRNGPLTLPPADQRWSGDRLGRAARLAVGSVVFRDSDQRLTTVGTWTLMAGRALGPLLLALAALAVRARVKR